MSASTQGPQGKQGPQGQQGQPGPQGKQGPPGLQGPPGKPIPGPRGADGQDGVDGRDGAPGPAGPAGERGPQGLPGAQGVPGRPGANGKDGEPGVGIKSVKVLPMREGQTLRVTLTDGAVNDSYIPATGRGGGSTITSFGGGRVPTLAHTFAVAGAIAVPVGQTGVIPSFFVPAAGVLSGARFVLGGGTSAAVDIQVNGVTKASITATTAPTSAAFSVPVAANDYVAIVVTSVTGSPTNLSVSIFANY